MKLCGSSLELGTFPAIDNEMSVQASDIFSKNLSPVSTSFLLLCHCDSRCMLELYCANIACSVAAA